jgi:hypothetical protein
MPRPHPLFHPGPSRTRRAVLGALAGCLAPLPARAATRLAFADLLRPDGEFTEIARRAAGGDVEMRGYMAPPLKSEINFFVLTKLPAAVCPFCDSAAAWPDDIVLVEMARPVHAIDYDRLIRVAGVLDLGEQTDAATGFVSRVRVRDARYSKI